MRYDLQTEQAAQPVVEGDRRFVGVNLKLPREYLPEGVVARSENKRFGKGAATRPGTRTPLFANLYPPTPFVGSGVYSNPNKYELGLLAVRGPTLSTVTGIRAGTVPISLPCENVFTIGGTVEFSQHFDKVLLHQADASAPTMIWDGLDADAGFRAITGPSFIAPGFGVIPNPPWSVSFQDRAWFPVPGKADTLGASNVNDPTTYDVALHEFRVNTGTADAITGAYPYLQNSLIIGKQRSIDMLANIPGDLGDSFLQNLLLGSPASAPPPRLQTVSSDVGIIARKSGLMAGGRFMFLSDSGAGGIYQITTDTHGNYVVDTTPVSEPIEPIIKRINWSVAAGAVGALDGRYAYWAIPIDDSPVNNAVIVYNLVTGLWESLDMWSAEPRDLVTGIPQEGDNPMDISNLFHLGLFGAGALFAVNHSGGKVHIMYLGADDQLGTAQGTSKIELYTYPIQDIVESRGYSIASGASRESRNELESLSASFDLATLEPSMDFAQILDGAEGVETTLGPTITRDRTQYETVRDDYELNNVNGDAEVSGREDYVVHADDGVLVKTGVRMARTWPWSHRVSLSLSGRFISFRVANRGGMCELRGITFESAPTRSEREAR